MTAYGIHTTKAHFWIHLWPLEAKVYWYFVPDMLEFIALTKPQHKVGHSKNGVATGAGYCIPKNAFLISSASVPSKYLDWFDWKNGTDREKGRRGALVVNVLVSKQAVFLPTWRSHRMETIVAQKDGCDGTAYCWADLKWEAKTECVDSEFLFIQTDESNHQPNILPNGETRRSELPPFEKGGSGKGVQ